MKRIFSPDSPYKKQARFLAVLWTLLIFIGCFTPGKDLPKVDMPLIDKWTHLVLFGGFTFLWLCAQPVIKAKPIVILFLISIGLGCFIEVMQGVLTFLGRSMELLDAIADSIGGIIGIGLFCLCAYIFNEERIQRQ
ncbi:MAG: VanZ family protein [Flavipsychrobacter sp.]|nr:VanZ family protein [Flavipsychrobacter sp.]